MLFLTISTYSQKKFRFIKNNIDKQELSFKLINNLIVIPLTINNQELSFILDTGVNKTILFNLYKNDSIGLNNVKKVLIKGLGTGEPMEALLSRNNKFSVKNIIGFEQDLYVILKDGFDISAKMGTTIHGIIGYQLLKDFIVKINYKTKKIVFYNPKTFKKRRCKKCEVLPLEFYRNKPYINVSVKIDSTDVKVKLLVDSGGTDAIWLFEDTKTELKTPKKYFRDILGEGFSGTVYGNRSKIKELTLGRFKIKKPTVSFLDSSSTFNARHFKERNGSIGGNILKRFKVWIDYPNKKIAFKKNASFSKGFYYNMSGLQIVYDGQELVREKTVNNQLEYLGGQDIDKNNSILFVNSYTYNFKPKYKIYNVVEGSPAAKVGVLKDDIIVRINGKPAYEYSLEEIIYLFQTKPNKKIKLKVKRGITDLKFEFNLEKRI